MKNRIFSAPAAKGLGFTQISSHIRITVYTCHNNNMVFANVLRIRIPIGGLKNMLAKFHGINVYRIQCGYILSNHMCFDLGWVVVRQAIQ